MKTFDFCIRLDELIIGCIKGGNTPKDLQLAMIEAIKELNNPESELIISAQCKENS